MKTIDMACICYQAHPDKFALNLVIGSQQDGSLRVYIVRDWPLISSCDVRYSMTRNMELETKRFIWIILKEYDTIIW